MPLIDMPMEQLKEYMGRNPKPADFDQYWERALIEMRGTNPEIELLKADFQTPQAECFDMYFTGVRGARIHAKYLRPVLQSTAKHPAVIQFHGYTGDAGDWNEKLNYVSLGYSVIAMDCRGQGGSSEDTGGVKGNTYKGHIIRGLDDSADQLLFRHIFLDTAQLAGIVMNLPEVDAARVGVTGLSQGGALTVACGALEPRLKLLAPIYPFLSDYKRVWEMDLATQAYEEIRTFFRQFDPQHTREQEIFTTLGYIDIQNLAQRIKSKVLWGIGLMDTICPPSTQFAAYNRITTEKRLEVYPDFGHESLPGLNDKILQFMQGL